MTNLRKTFEYSVSSLPSVAMVLGGTVVGVDGYNYERYDIALGGLALTAIGFELWGLKNQQNRILGIFNFQSSGFFSSIGNRMGALGLAACVFLGGGEVVHMMIRHDMELSDFFDKVKLNQFVNDPGMYKVFANLTVYPAASLLDLEKVGKFFKKHDKETYQRTMQISLLLLGAFLIYRFGDVGKIFSAQTFGKLNMSANFLSIRELLTKKRDVHEKISSETTLRNTPMSWLK